jgi:hypothetical protein
MIIRSKTLGKIKVHKVEYHCNGITGESFHTVAFTSEAGDLVAVVFEARLHTAIIDPHFPSLKFRGDDFDPHMREAIKKWEESQSEA